MCCSTVIITCLFLCIAKKFTSADAHECTVCFYPSFMYILLYVELYLCVCECVCVCVRVCVCWGKLKWSNTKQTRPRAHTRARTHTHTCLTMAWCWVSHPFRQLDATAHQEAAEWEVKSLSEPACAAVHLKWRGSKGGYFDRVELNNISAILNDGLLTCRLGCAFQAAAVHWNDLCVCPRVSVCLPVRTGRWFLQAGNRGPRCSRMMLRERGACRHGDTSPGESHGQGVGGNYAAVLEVLWLFRHVAQDNNAAGTEGHRSGLLKLCFGWMYKNMHYIYIHYRSNVWGHLEMSLFF